MSAVMHVAPKRQNIYERVFPAEFDAQREVFFHPEEPDQVACDILEIGPGQGDFLFATAAAFPDKQIVAIELRDKRFSKLMRRCDADACDNLLLILGDARSVVGRYIPKDSLTEIYILFPDPWPKRRHLFLRLMQREFIAQLAGCLKPNGKLVFRTDMEDYAIAAASNAAGVPALKEAECETVNSELAATPTRFEERGRAAGETIHTLIWVRV